VAKIKEIATWKSRKNAHEMQTLFEKGWVKKEKKLQVNTRSRSYSSLKSG